MRMKIFLPLSSFVSWACLHNLELVKFYFFLLRRSFSGVPSLYIVNVFPSFLPEFDQNIETKIHVLSENN